MKITLWRAAKEKEPYFGEGSFWADSRSIPEGYAAPDGWLPWGGPIIYRAEIELGRDDVADLGQRPWEALREHGFDPDDYLEPIYEVVQALKKYFVRRGYQWVAFVDVDTGDEAKTWLYLGGDAIPATRES